MVGKGIVQEGILDIKSPASGLARGWRISPWKSRLVKLVERDNGEIELEIYQTPDDKLVETYNLHDITDVTMVTSKTHLHAFEIVSSSSSVLVLSGSTELESREWIWTLRKIFWPHALVDNEAHDQIQIHLLSGRGTQSLGLSEGIYDLRISVTAIKLNFISKYETRDPRSTPVEPFQQKENRKSASFPLTAIGRFKLETHKGRRQLIMETTSEFESGSYSFVFEADDGNMDVIKGVMDLVKNTFFRATNNLHDCIATSQWNFDTET